MKKISKIIVMAGIIASGLQASASEFKPELFTGIYHVSNPECLGNSGNGKVDDVLIIARKGEDGIGTVHLTSPISDYFNTKKVSHSDRGEDFGPYISKTSSSFKKNRFSDCWRRLELMIVIPTFESQCKTLELSEDGSLLYSGKPDEVKGQSCRLERSQDQSPMAMAELLVKQHEYFEASKLSDILKERFYKPTTTEAEKTEIRGAIALLHRTFPMEFQGSSAQKSSSGAEAQSSRGAQ